MNTKSFVLNHPSIRRYQHITMHLSNKHKKNPSKAVFVFMKNLRSKRERDEGGREREGRGEREEGREREQGRGERETKGGEDTIFSAPGIFQILVSSFQVSSFLLSGA